MPDLDINREVFLAEVRHPLSLPLNTVRGKCNVMLSEPNKRVADAIADFTDKRNKRHLYICRYKIVKRNGELSLVALNDHPRTTPPKQTVSPIKIINKNSVQKVRKLSAEHEVEHLFSGSDSEYDESPAKGLRCTDGHNSSFGARRNLNSSLNDAAGNALVASIVASPYRKKNELKMTIKVTRKDE